MGFLSLKPHCNSLLTIYVRFENMTQLVSLLVTLENVAHCWGFGFVWVFLGGLFLFIFLTVLHLSFIYSLPWLVFIQIKWDPKDAVILLKFILPYLAW